jgi:hypothetical protein
MTDRERQHGDAEQSITLSRRQTLGAVGIAGFAGLSGAVASASADASSHRSEVSVIGNPNFINDAHGNGPPFDYNTMLFDPGPESIPLNELVAADDTFGNDLFRGLPDSRRLVNKPPEGYDREAGYDESWEPVIWGEYEEVTGEATVGDDGQAVEITVENGIPHGQYTVWVVKFAALENPDEFDQFVTPAGNGLVGFHNLGPKDGDRGSAENTFTLDEVGDGSIEREQEGGSLTGIPGYREPGYPFVGEVDDYEQDEEELTQISSNLRDEDEIHFVGAYHYDDQTWGVYPGPYHVNHFDARFQF